jgi:hypothetical protein
MVLIVVLQTHSLDSSGTDHILTTPLIECEKLGMLLSGERHLELATLRSGSQRTLAHL